MEGKEVLRESGVQVSWIQDLWKGKKEEEEGDEFIE